MPLKDKNTPPYKKGRINHNHPKTAIDTLIDNKIAKIGTPLLVKVVAVESGGVALTGRVDVLPLVTKADANNVPYKQAVIYGVPYLRVQGGNSAIIIDPVAGDIGFIVISGRDHSHVLETRETAPPASQRIFSMSDCVYIGGFINDAPSQYIQLTTEGIKIVSPHKITIEAAGIEANCDIKTSGNILAGGDMKASGDVKAGSISLKSHTHSGVQSGGSNTGKPQ